MSNPNLPPSLNPDERSAARIAALERRIAALERLNLQAQGFVDGTRMRVEIGRTASGRYGIRIYDGAGSLIYDYTTA